MQDKEKIIEYIWPQIEKAVKVQWGFYFGKKPRTGFITNLKLVFEEEMREVKENDS